MNCKQGDLAIIVRADNPNNIGKVVRCVYYNRFKLVYNSRGAFMAADVWDIELQPGVLCYDGTLASVSMDKDLRPIRDPGDDAKDEMLRPLPVEDQIPTKVLSD